MSEGISYKRRWQAITLGTLVLVPAYWGILVGAVSAASDDRSGIANPAAAVSFGVALLPFVFVVLAFTSANHRAPTAVIKAMALALLVGLTASVVFMDVVSGVVAGAGAGGIVALRLDPPSTWRTRAVGVAVAVAYTFVLARLASTAALLPAPIFPFTAIGVADHLAERRAEREPVVSTS